MKSNRLEAFSDGVLAIILTIMVLELKAPKEASWQALLSLLPVFLSYVLSFVNVGIYWNNHHHLLHTVTRVSAGILWANLHLLFWLSLIPFTTAWVGANDFAALPMAIYGLVLLMSGLAYNFLQNAILAQQGQQSLLARALGDDLKGRTSAILYASALPTAFINPWIAGGLYVTVALMWLIPDQRIEKVLAEEE
jgi:uncharacterized membrane protein